MGSWSLRRSRVQIRLEIKADVAHRPVRELIDPWSSAPSSLRSCFHMPHQTALELNGHAGESNATHMVDNIHVTVR